MQKAGIRFVRVGEFAWSTMEPSEGSSISIGWIKRSHWRRSTASSSCLGTPTRGASGLADAEVSGYAAIGEDGRRAVHGNRQHFSFTSPRYREFCRRMAAEMAKRFGHNPNVIGWQIDNEYATYSYDDDTRGQFQQWLKAKYGTLDNLNARWTTAYWSQTYFASGTRFRFRWVGTIRA